MKGNKFKLIRFWSCYFVILIITVSHKKRMVCNVFIQQYYQPAPLRHLHEEWISYTGACLFKSVRRVPPVGFITSSSGSKHPLCGWRSWSQDPRSHTVLCHEAWLPVHTEDKQDNRFEQLWLQDLWTCKMLRMTHCCNIKRARLPLHQPGQYFLLRNQTQKI